MGSVTRTSATGAAGWTADSVTLTPADGCQMLASQDAQRQAVTVINDADSTGDLWVVPNAGQTRGGIRLKPGAGLPIASVAAVYGYATVGTVAVYLLGESGTVC